MSSPAEFTIASVKARQILDSRGNPTVEVDLTVHGLAGVFRAAVPSGASTGIYEALELRDGDKKVFGGKGVSKAIDNVNSVIGPAVIGMNVREQRKIDEFMVQTLDGTKTENGWTKAKLGANAILGVSMAVARAGAAAAGLPLYAYIATLAGRSADSAVVLPVPFLNVLNAGEHSGAPLVFQEFMLAPVGARSFAEALRMGAEVYAALKSVVKKRYGASAVGVGDEGGFAPPLADPESALSLLADAITAAGYSQESIKIALDVAASEFKVDGADAYDLNKKLRAEGRVAADAPEGRLTAAALADTYATLAQRFGIVSIEDGFDQDDWTAWTAFTGRLGAGVQVVGDDLTVTNPARVARAIADRACNALLLKVNQIGSVTEAVDAVGMSQAAGWGVMASHRSGETEDTFIADLSVGLRTGQIKSGAPSRSERTAKYNQLLRIEEALGARAVYAGTHFRNPVAAVTAAGGVTA